MPVSASRWILGVDTGGTYTDAVIYDEGSNSLLAKAKAPTTHDDLAVGIGQAIERVLAAGSVDPSALGFVSLSTTLATNALVEGRGSPGGFGDDRVRGGRARQGWFARGDRPRFGGDGGGRTHTVRCRSRTARHRRRLLRRSQRSHHRWMASRSRRSSACATPTMRSPLVT